MRMAARRPTRWRAFALVTAGMALLLGALGFCATAALDIAARRTPHIPLGRFEDRSPVVADAEGQVLRAFLAQDGRWRLLTRPEDVPKPYLDMLLAYEDQRFYSHHGVDARSLARAALQALWYGHAVSGASTLTMQVVRLLEPQPSGFMGKLRQMILARQLEQRLSKRQILTLYLTLAPFGGNIEGVRAASLAYFHKEPPKLTAAEAAMLVALPQAPEARRPDRNPDVAARVWRRVTARMVQQGVIEEAALGPLIGPPTADRAEIAFAAPHLAERLLRQEPGRRLIATLIDGPLQRRVESILADAVRSTPGEVNAAALVVRNRDLAVLAYAGGADYRSLTRSGSIDLTAAVRSPGSALKPFIYGMGFERRIIHPETVLTDAPVQFGTYEPENFSGQYAGDMTVRDALVRSINTAAVSVLDRIGPAAFMTRLRNAGAPIRITDTDRDAGLAIGLGGGGITLTDLAMLYAGLANGGEVRDLRLRPTDPLSPPRQLLSDEAAWAVTDILADGMPPPGFARRAAADGSRRIAYKTGTSFGFRDAWAAGYDGLSTVVVWVGRPDGQPNVGAYGATAAAPLLFRIFDALPVPGGDVAGEPPSGTILAARNGLPDRLQRLDAGPLEASRQKLRILFPQKDATLAFTGAGGKGSLPLEVQGGTAPYVWIANDRPVGGPTYDARTPWQPPGRGSSRITVLDAAGRRDSVDVWIE